MPTSFVILADTHVPRCARELPPQLWEAIESADIVIHGGDWTDVARLDELVFGHSHIPWDSVSPAGMRLLNPGSPTDRRRQPVGAYLTATIDAGQLRNVTLVPVGSSRPATVRTRRAR